MPDLERMQRWMQAVLMHPEGVEAGVEEAREHLDVGPADVEQVVTPSRALSGLERLAVYHNAYHARLLECLREEFPVLFQTLGEELFNTFAVGYLVKYPSRSYTLIHLGERFPQYLAQTRAEEGGAGTPDAWSDFLIDLATLEWTINAVFDGQGVEGQGGVGLDELRAVGPERWAMARLVPVPCLRLLQLRSPVHEYYRAVRAGEETAPGSPRETFLAITRRDYVVRQHELARAEYELLSGLVAGRTVGEAITPVAQANPGDLPRLAADLHDWFRAWAAHGYFGAVELGP